MCHIILYGSILQAHLPLDMNNGIGTFLITLTYQNRSIQISRHSLWLVASQHNPSCPNLIKTILHRLKFNISLHTYSTLVASNYNFSVVAMSSQAAIPSFTAAHRTSAQPPHPSVFWIISEICANFVFADSFLCSTTPDQEGAVHTILSPNVSHIS